MDESANGEPAPKKQGLTPPWKPGQSGNPKGRPKGARNKLGEAFLEDMLNAWESQGPAAIQKVIEKKPEAFLKVVADLLPRDMNLNINNLDNLTDEQLLMKLAHFTKVAGPLLEAMQANAEPGSATVRH